MLSWIRNTRWTTKIIGGLCITLLLYLAVQTWHLYLQGIEGNPFQTIYRTKVVKVLEPAPLGRKEQRVSYPCVPIQAIVPKASHSREKGDSRPANDKLDTIQRISVQPLSPSGEQLPEYPLLLQRYKVSETLFAGSILEVWLQADGSVETKVAYKQPLAELGRLREVGLWVGPELSNGPEGSASGWAADLSYQQDLFRLGPAWTRLRVEAGYSSSLGTNVKAQIGIPVIRF